MKTLLTIVLLVLSAQAFSDDAASHYDRIQLSASAQQQVDNDILIVQMYAEQEGSDPSLLADGVNRKIRKAVDRLKVHDDIKLQTSAYSTQPVYHNNKIKRWRVRQSLTLRSANMTRLSALLAELQQTLALQSMQFVVSPQSRERTNDALIRKALAAFEARARLVSEQLGRKHYRIVDMNINTSGGGRPYPVMARAVMMDAAAAAPAVEAGEQTLQVTVSGRIELQ